jgi:hypothetical protein
VLKSIKVVLCATKNLGAGKPRSGLERPHFCHRLRGQNDLWGRSSPVEMTQIVFCPRAYTYVVNLACGDETISNNERRRSRWQY